MLSKVDGNLSVCVRIQTQIFETLPATFTMKKLKAVELKPVGGANDVEHLDSLCGHRTVARDVLFD